MALNDLISGVPNALPIGNPSGQSGTSKFFLGSDPFIQNVSQFTPQQIQALNQILSQGLGGISSQNLDFSPIEQHARTQFQQQTVPSIAERFSSLGQGSQRSSGFAQALGSAGADLESGLASMRSQYGLQQNALLQNLLGLGLQPQFESLYHARQPGFIESMLGALFKGIGKRLP